MRKCSSTILYAACTFRPYKSTPVLKLFRTFTGRMTKGLSLRMVFSLLFFQDTLFPACARESKARTGRFLRGKKLISDHHGHFSSLRGPHEAANGQDS